MNSESGAAKSFLTQLVHRTLELPSALRPRLASPFETPVAPAVEADDDGRGLRAHEARTPAPTELEARLDAILAMPTRQPTRVSAGPGEPTVEAESRITEGHDPSRPVEIPLPPPSPQHTAWIDPLDVRREAATISPRVVEAGQPRPAHADSDRPRVTAVPTAMPRTAHLGETSAPAGLHPAVSALGRGPRVERPQPQSRAETLSPSEHRLLEPAPSRRDTADPTRGGRPESDAQVMPQRTRDLTNHDLAVPLAPDRSHQPRRSRDQAEGVQMPVTSPPASSRPPRGSPKEGSLLARLPQGQPALPGPTTPRRASESSRTAPTIQVTIGRVEVRAITTAAPVRPPTSTKPALALDEYLRQRREARR